MSLGLDFDEMDLASFIRDAYLHLVDPAVCWQRSRKRTFCWELRTCDGKAASELETLSSKDNNNDKTRR